MISYTTFEHFEINRFGVMLRSPDKQTNKQTDSKIIRTPTDIVGVGKYRVAPIAYCKPMLANE